MSSPPGYTRTRSPRCVRTRTATASRWSRFRSRGGVTDPEAWVEAIDDDTSAAIFAQPNFYGAVEDAAALSAAAKGEGGEQLVTIAQVDPIVLGILAPPGECGVDVAVGEGQSLGNRLDFGGPSFGFFAAREDYLRRMPGRIAGETTDVDGRRGFVLTLQTREQHIRREKATSNICTSQALNALAGVVYLSWLGRRGFVELGELLLRRTHYARETLCALDGVAPLHSQPVVREFARTPRRGRRRRAPPLCCRRASTPAPTSTRSPAASRIAAACWSRSPSGARAPTSTACRGARRGCRAERRSPMAEPPSGRELANGDAGASRGGCLA